MQDFTPPIIAILKNEGSIELYHGPAGQGIGVSIVLRFNWFNGPDSMSWDR